MNNQNREYLEKRNVLWQKLRELEPDDEHVEALILELMEHAHISREQVLEGLGWFEKLER
jgi:coproporphyrinogen III oxidase-like Fe-S oxidoreductase